MWSTQDPSKLEDSRIQESRIIPGIWETFGSTCKMQKFRSPRYPSYVRRYPRRYLASCDQHIGTETPFIRTILGVTQLRGWIVDSFSRSFPLRSLFPVISSRNRGERKKASGDKAPMSPIVGGGGEDWGLQPEERERESTNYLTNTNSRLNSKLRRYNVSRRETWLHRRAFVESFSYIHIRLVYKYDIMSVKIISICFNMKIKNY